MLVEENVSDKSVIGLAKESAIDDFIPRFHDLAFLHFEWFGQVVKSHSLVSITRR